MLRIRDYVFNSLNTVKPSGVSILFTKEKRQEGECIKAVSQEQPFSLTKRFEDNYGDLYLKNKHTADPDVTIWIIYGAITGTWTGFNTA